MKRSVSATEDETINPFTNANMHLDTICHIKNSEFGCRETFTDSLAFKISTAGLYT
jgi:hypothetical protein